MINSFNEIFQDTLYFSFILRIKRKVENMNRVLDYIHTYIAEHGTSPSVRKIESGVGIPRTTVHRHLVALNDTGKVRYENGVLETPESEKFFHDTVTVALLGEVACGSPTCEEEFVEAYLPFPRELLGDGEYFLLRAKGTSMIEAGIDPGDLVVVKKQSTAKPGQIAVVLVDGEITLKRIYPDPEHKRIRLHPENSEMEDIFVREARIQGVATRVWKELQ